MPARKVAAIKKGRNNLLKLTPPEKIATISERWAILEVKRIRAMKMMSGLKRFP